MNKFKKLVAVLVSVVMACVFATGVFADSVNDLNTDKAKLIEYLNSKGVTGMNDVVNALTADKLAVLRANRATLTTELDKVKAAVSAAKSADEAQKAVDAAMNETSGILSQANITVTATVSVSAGEIKAIPKAVTKDADGNEVSGIATVTIPLSSNTKSDSGNSNKNNAAAGSDSETISAASNPITASSSAVIKATGDNSMMVISTVVLAVVGILGMAARKEQGLAL